ncbi:hypothetical protein PO909_026659, partial [Leuciscus waleckii]
QVDEHTLTDQRDQHNKDPFPIYTAIDKQCKQQKDADPWFEFTPYEAGYSLTGAFVETSNFGSKFENGRKIKNQPEIDMLYLQALCSSVLADEEEIWKWIKDPNSPPIDECHQVLLNLVNMNLAMLKDVDPSAFDKDIRAKLTDVCLSICRCLVLWIWGRKHNFHNMTDAAVPAALLKSETRDYIDTALLLNPPYFSVLREERDIDLIISLDFSEDDPFMTVREAAETCRKLKIPFPEANITSELSEKPKDFYVFKGQNTPTVIHIPLFKMVNCGDKIEAWKNKYATFQGPYSAEMITDLMKVAGKNITNNRVKLLEQIRAVTKAKLIQAMARQNPTL